MIIERKTVLRNISIVVKIAAADWVEDAKTFGNSIGRAGVQCVLEDIFTTFPDWRMEVQETVADGDVVFVHREVSGTHRGIGKLRVNGGMLVDIGLASSTLFGKAIIDAVWIINNCA